MEIGEIERQSSSLTSAEARDPYGIFDNFRPDRRIESGHLVNRESQISAEDVARLTEALEVVKVDEMSLETYLFRSVALLR